MDEDGRSLTTLDLVLDEGETRESAERIAELVGATITHELRDQPELGYYALELDVESFEARDTIVQRIAAQPGVHSVGPSHVVTDPWRNRASRRNAAMGE
jgi:hypothetical protein